MSISKRLRTASVAVFSAAMSNRGQTSYGSLNSAGFVKRILKSFKIPTRSEQKYLNIAAGRDGVFISENRQLVRVATIRDGFSQISPSLQVFSQFSTCKLTVAMGERPSHFLEA
jgi:hypothetical protein